MPSPQEIAAGLSPGDDDALRCFIAPPKSYHAQLDYADGMVYIAVCPQLSSVRVRNLVNQGLVNVDMFGKADLTPLGREVAAVLTDKETL